MNTVKVLQVCVCVLILGQFLVSGAVPLDCKDDAGSRCASISQEKLLDRVIQHAELIYRVSEECCTLFEDMFVPYPLHVLINQAGNTCHSKHIPIPTSKSEIQQISDSWLLHSVLFLVQSWMEPLLYLQTTLDRYDDAPNALLSKTKWVSDKLLSLEQGVVVLIRKMLDEGIMASSTIFDHTQSPYDGQFPEVLESVIRDYHLLTCFKKDTHKMETFLKLLKCRQSNKLSCLPQ
ncbi:somatolactin alpha precursor [Danio rerio]|uniref:Somatolactin alpha n=2 Tax=Danio rerio TaxID=7955 RepID=Q330L3_DANRE|nr:somatolactin alpha precursor [Danio rerio]AAR25212.1 somatolactin alpha [Danio rerio]|eukprot:NP_001032795.1 somatolactin alpha precursor [Danio rerio]